MKKRLDKKVIEKIRLEYVCGNSAKYTAMVVFGDESRSQLVRNYFAAFDEGYMRTTEHQTQHLKRRGYKTQYEYSKRDRTRRRYEILPEDLEVLNTDEKTCLIFELMGRLKPVKQDWYELIFLNFFDSMTVKEIAEKYRTSSRNVYRKIERGIKRMKAIVEEVGIENLIKD